MASDADGITLFAIEKDAEAGRIEVRFPYFITKAAPVSGVVSMIDIEVAMDQLWAPLYYRLIFGHGPLRPDLAHTLVAQLLGGIGSGLSHESTA